MLARVSNIEAFRQWKNWQPLFDGQEEPSIEDLVRFITVDDPTPAMKAGTAFHAAIEHAAFGEHETLEAMGYTFHLKGHGSIVLADVRELRCSRVYGDLTVTGQVDCISGKTVWDHKTTSRLDAERYLTGSQWKFYLDVFEADVFHWNVFEIKELEPQVYAVSEPHLLTAYRYPGMSDDCHRLASEFLDFARVHMPEKIGRAAA